MTPPRGSGPTPPPYLLVVENVQSGAAPGERRRPPASYGVETRETVLGRAPGCTVRLDDLFVSRRHARLVLRDQELYLEDLGSTNESRVNGAPVPTRVRIHPGDALAFGGARCRIEIAGARSEPVEPTEAGPAREAAVPEVPDPATSAAEAPAAEESGGWAEAGGVSGEAETGDGSDWGDAGETADWGEAEPAAASPKSEAPAEELAGEPAEEPASEPAKEFDGSPAESWRSFESSRFFVAGPLPGEPERARRRFLTVVLGAAAVITAAVLIFG